MSAPVKMHKYSNGVKVASLLQNILQVYCIEENLVKHEQLLIGLCPIGV